MKPLISIETVPISIEYTTVKAETRPRPQAGGDAGSAKLNIAKGAKQLTISSAPINIQLQDKFENVGDSMAYTATAEYSKDGVLSMNVRIQGDAGADGGLRFKAAGQGINRMADALPKSSGAEAPFSEMRINFDMGGISQAPEIHSSDVEASFMPPDIQVDIKEYPRVIIKYVGGPIYFPRSSNPNYEPPASEATFKAEA
ncbi:MAG: hypothetical protein LBG71_00520 [Clostridiales Family XIII bacterium]|jgi:hypothetical protein|nr:hypothetical protein [Clostridiales Family XIII bacterium]